MIAPAELLQEIPLYRRLPPEERQRLAEVSRVKAYSRGETVFSEGRRARPSTPSRADA